MTASPMPHRILLLDRDGVLNQDYPDYVQRAEQVVILPGVPEALGRLRRAGVKVLVITNQACIGKGIVTLAELEKIHATLQHGFAEADGGVDQFFFCPHTNEDCCGCRKPAPGLILKAQEAWGFDPKQVWMVGDATRDAQAALAAGCRPAIVRTGKGEATARELPQLPAFDNLPLFVDAFLSGRLPPR